MARPLATAVFCRPRAHTMDARGGFRMQQPTAVRHTVNLTGRERAVITGVSDVDLSLIHI